MGTKKIDRALNTYYAKYKDGEVLYWHRPNYAPVITETIVKVWRVGPKGGVKVLHDQSFTSKYGYITTNEQAMKEFMWAKLSAEAL
jgi:hypothetical protein